jgi:hypothetical protein
LSEDRNASLKKLDHGQNPKKKLVSVNFSHALFSLLSTHDDLVMQAFVWLPMVWFKAIQFGMAQFGTSYAN